MLDNGYRLKNMMKVRVFSSGLNFAILMYVPVAETSCSSPRIRRISVTAGSFHLTRVIGRNSGRKMRRSLNLLKESLASSAMDMDMSRKNVLII